MWALFVMAFLGVGYAIFSSLCGNNATPDRDNVSGDSSSGDCKKVLPCTVEKDLKTIPLVSDSDLREMLQGFSNPLLLEVGETSDRFRTSVIPGAICVSLDQLDKLIAWVPPNQDVVIYSMGAHNERLIDMIEYSLYRMNVFVLQVRSGAWEVETDTNVKAV